MKTKSKQVLRSSNLFSLLKKLSPAEMSELADYVSMPAVNNRKSVAELFRIIKRHHPEFTDEATDRRKLFSELFPGKKFNDSAIRPLIHYLNELAIDFVTLKFFKSNRSIYDHCRINSLMERREFKATARALAKTQTHLSPGKVNASQYFYHSHLLKNSRLVHYSRSRDGIYQKFLPEINLHNAFEDLTLYYVLRTLQMYLNVLNINKVFGTGMPVDSFVRSISSFEMDILLKQPVISIYYHLTKLLTDDANTDHYKKVRGLVKANRNILHINDLHEIYINLENYCNNKILNGEERFLREKFEIYKEEIDIGLHKASGSLSPIFLKSAVSLALRINKLSWAKSFLHSCAEDVKKHNALRNSYLFSLSSCEFAEGNFGKSLENLSLIKYDDDYMNIDCRILQVLNHFETGAHDTMLNSLESLRHLLNSDKSIPNSRKLIYLNFNRHFRKFVKLIERNDSEGLLVLRDKIESTLQISQKHWLLKKIDSLIRN